MRTTLTAHGAPPFYTRSMDAPRPIMVHGTVGGAATWVGQHGAFAGAAAIALPGFPLGEPISDVDQAVAFLTELVTRVPAPRVLVGHELGAALAMEACARRPDLADGLVVSGLGANGPTTCPADVDETLDACLGDPSGDAGSVLRRALEATGDDTRTRSATLAAGLDPLAAAARLPMPVLAITGDADPVVPLAAVATLADAVPDCMGAIIPDAKHLPMADAAVPYNLLVAAFLARIETGA